MARFTQQYLLPVLQGAVDADKVLAYSVEDALFSFCDVLSKKVGVSAHVLHREARAFLATYEESDPCSVTRCKGACKKDRNGRTCPFKPLWHGYCKKHEYQYDEKVRENERIARRAENQIVHKGHGPDETDVPGCPGCEKKKKMLAEIGS